MSFALGAFGSVLTVGLVIYFGADAAAATLDDALTWLRRAAFGLAALVLLVAAVRALRPRRRKGVGLPPWFNPFTAIGLGVLMTGADLPNAFPYFIAIERLVNADTTTGVAVLVLAGYAVIYCLPCLLLLAAGLSNADPVRRLLRRLHDKFGTAAELPANGWKAAIYLGASILVTSIAATA